MSIGGGFANSNEHVVIYTVPVWVKKLLAGITQGVLAAP
jgi:hypothetical protein